MMKTRFNYWPFTLLILTFGLAGCSGATNTTAALIPISVQLSFTHQAEFAGFYAAEQQGYYEEEGLAVTFHEGGPEVDFLAPVLNGTAQFGVAPPADLILARAAGKPIRGIAVIYRRSPIVFFALANSGIMRPQDFVGKKIRSTTTLDQTLRAMMNQIGIRPDQYEVVYLPSEVALFASGEVPVWGGYVNVFVIDVQQQGYQINVIYPDDYRVHFYGDVLITTDELIRRDPDLVQRFTRATLKGWTYVVENPQTVGEFVREYNPNADPELEIARMTASIPLVNTGEDFIGWMEPEIWEDMGRLLREQGELSDRLNVADVYTLQFLKEIYGE